MTDTAGDDTNESGADASSARSDSDDDAEEYHDVTRRTTATGKFVTVRTTPCHVVRDTTLAQL